jgi:hypothetical protein
MKFVYVYWLIFYMQIIITDEFKVLHTVNLKMIEILDWIVYLANQSKKIYLYLV